MEINFKYKIGQLVYYNNHLYRVLSRCYLETYTQKIVKYNLKSTDDTEVYGYVTNIWEEDIYTLKLV